jgi:hypothetical protein
MAAETFEGWFGGPEAHRVVLALCQELSFRERLPSQQ